MRPPLRFCFCFCSAFAPASAVSLPGRAFIYTEHVYITKHALDAFVASGEHLSLRMQDAAKMTSQARSVAFFAAALLASIAPGRGRAR